MINKDTKILLKTKLLILVSNDESWQKRYSSLLSGSENCVDFGVLIKTCNACTSWEERKKNERELYEQFIVTHDCPIKSEGSADSMKAACLDDCFKNSIENKRLRILITLELGTQKHK